MATNNNYTYVDSRPSVESYGHYKTQPFEKLVPYQVTISEIVDDNSSLRLSIPVGRKLTFRDYSPEGICKSRSGKAHYIKFIDCENKEGLNWFAAKVSQACVDVWRAMGTYVLARFHQLGTIDKKVSPKALIQSGLPSLQESLEKGSSELTLFLSEYTKVHQFDGKTLDLYTVDELAGNSKQSFFNVEVNVKTFEFLYNAVDKVIAIRCFTNLADITWLNVPGIKPHVDVASLASDQKDKKDEERLLVLTSFVAEKLGESIPDSQPTPLHGSTGGKLKPSIYSQNQGKKRKKEENEDEDIY